MIQYTAQLLFRRHKIYPCRLKTLLQKASNQTCLPCNFLFEALI
ncbi:hypothetical protein F528_1502 [Neisseria meningitidis 992008]|uniref:Uncharacterized protein n=2 Tax=Neisseria meningitidis TaxID=487 RepID=X5F9U4_NEIME|nr:hypothetical protein NMA510612_1682 [Neisseria meningitidis]KER39544.1 hypothetical protein F528_1502 [Neisseria meningitidis 992008]CBA07919.1 hypothetical protein predicted by Glimmer/Critica [Neisseria meningitidis alpha275]